MAAKLPMKSLAEMKSGESMVKPTETTPLPDHTVAVLESDEPFAPEIW